jgi:hypothetical protein
MAAQEVTTDKKCNLRLCCRSKAKDKAKKIAMEFLVMLNDPDLCLTSNALEEVFKQNEKKVN